MATNFHSDLPNNQIHNPKDFSEAKNSSVPVKTNAGILEWVASPFNISTTITCGSDTAGVLHNSFFHIFYDNTVSIEVHFSVTGDATAFVPTTGFTQSSVSIAANATAIQVAEAIKVELDRLTAAGTAAFVTSVNGTGKCTFSGMSNTIGTIDKGTGFVFANTRTPYGSQNLVSINGEIQWETSSPGGVTSIVAGTGITIAPAGGTGDVTITNSSPPSSNFMSQNIEGYGSIAVGIEWALSNAQYNSEHKFKTNLGSVGSVSISPKNMMNTSIWTNPTPSIPARWNGWVSGVGAITLSLLRVKMQCPIPAEYPTTADFCRIATQTIILTGNSTPLCFDLSSFTNCDGWDEHIEVNETLCITASCTGKSASFNMNCNILLSQV